MVRVVYVRVRTLMLNNAHSRHNAMQIEKFVEKFLEVFQLNEVLY